MIIGVSGKKRSGKDTFYNIVKNELSGKHTVKKYAFADKVKDYAIRYFNVKREEIKNEENRFILQGIGQLMRSESNPKYWINILIADMMQSRLKTPGEISIITDIRHVNEVEEIINLDNSIVVRIDRKIDLYDNHISENDLNDYPFDFHINNDGDIDNYRSEVVKWIRLNLPWITHW